MRHNTPIALFIVLSLSILSACGPQTSKPDQSADAVELDLQAKELYRSGSFAAAAEEYLRLELADPANANRYRLGAIDSYIQNQDIEIAQERLQQLSANKLSNNQTFLKIIFTAQILLAQNNSVDAATMLDIVPAEDSSRTALAKFHETRANILEAQEKYFASASERLLLNSYLDNAETISGNYQNLWQNLSLLSVDELDTHRASNVGTLSSWLELAILNKTMLQNTNNLEAAIISWQQRYPDHPALIEIVPGIIDQSRQLAEMPSQIALLLPFSGRYHDASIAIRDGFVASWYDSRNEKPIIKVYDTDADNVVEVYAQAIQEGAEFVIGPLQKTAISNLINQTEITIPTLVLNYHDDNLTGSFTSKNTSLPKLLQFGLSPEEEAKQVAERAWFDGHARAIVVSTDDSRGKRINDAFASHWQELGGEVLDNIAISREIETLNTRVRAALNIDQSEQRGKTLRSKLQRSLKTEIRRRQDVDMIFMVIPPAIARQLVPQLTYYDTSDISLYSISNIYSGKVNQRQDNDINRVNFVDMPWVVDPANEYSPLNRMIERYQKPTLSNYKRLYAFGIDAYQLISLHSELILQPGNQYSGKTGTIKIDGQGKVHRTLVWAQFVNGKPEIKDSSGLN